MFRRSTRIRFAIKLGIYQISPERLYIIFMMGCLHSAAQPDQGPSTEDYRHQVECRYI